MGLSFRKTINLGGVFRINLSRSGIGYSFGGKAFRVTRTAKGTFRTTITIPGTGLSWREEIKNTENNSDISHRNICESNYEDCIKIHSSEIDNFQNDEGFQELLSEINKISIVKNKHDENLIILLASFCAIMLLIVLFNKLLFFWMLILSIIIILL